MHVQLNKRIKKAGLILFIFIIPVMQLSGVMAEEEEEGQLPEPVSSSELNENPSHQVAHTSLDSEASQASPPSTLIFLPAIFQSEETPEDFSYMTDQEVAVLELVNVEREQAGCGPVSPEPHLRTAAYLHSKDMADNGYFAHTGLNGSRFWERAQDAGYEGFAAGENIAAGYRSPESVMNGWMNSEGHRNNILNCSHTHLGVGYYYGSGSPYGTYWTQVFGRE